MRKRRGEKARAGSAAVLVPAAGRLPRAAARALRRERAPARACSSARRSAPPERAPQPDPRVPEASRSTLCAGRSPGRACAALHRPGRPAGERSRAAARSCCSSATPTATGAPTAGVTLLDGPRTAPRPRPARRLALRRRDRRHRPRPLRPATQRSIGGAYERIVTGLPGGGNHWTRTRPHRPRRLALRDVGSSCNVCVEEDPRRAAMLRYRPDGSGEEIFASGPAQRGRLRLAARHGRALRDRQRPRPARRRLPALRAQPGRRRAASTAGPSPTATTCPTRTSAQARRRGSHVRFRRPTLSPPTTRRSASPSSAETRFRPTIAARRSRAARLLEPHREGRLQGRVAALDARDGTIEERDFLTGFEVDDDVIGRPVDVAEGPDGAFYVSDDYAGRDLPRGLSRRRTRPDAARSTMTAQRTPAQRG